MAFFVLFFQKKNIFPLKIVDSQDPHSSLTRIHSLDLFIFMCALADHFPFLLPIQQNTDFSAAKVEAREAFGAAAVRRLPASLFRSP